MKLSIIESIETIVGNNITLEPAFLRPGQPLGGLMPSQKGRPKYLLHNEQLTGLNLANTSLTDEKWDAIQRVSGFQPEHILGLNLSDNQLTRLHFPAGYTGLQQVFASDNQLTELHFAADCPQLERLQVDNNKLHELLLPEGAGFEKLELVHIAGNPLSASFEAAAKEGPAAFARFVRRLAQQGVAETYEIKMLIVGEGETGKTTLWKFLQDNQHVPVAGQPSTVGIGIREGLVFKHADLPGTDFLVNLWDFGGQEIQYMTHQFFLTRRSFYVLLADGRREVGNFPYWFKVIHLLGADPAGGEKLPVLVLLNEKGNPIAKMPYDPASTAVDFPRLDVLKYDVDFGKQDVRLSNLPKYIEEIVSRRFPHLPLKVPARWGQVRVELLRLRNEEKKNYIRAADLEAICRTEGITDEQECLDLSRLLHDLGIILHYQDVRVLHNFIILHPEWAVNAVYELMRHPKVRDENQGRFDHSLLNSVWSACGYTADEIDGLLSLMLKDGFEVCFQTKEHEKTLFIAPQLLPEFKPEFDWPEKEVVLRYIYQYAFMPKGIVGRLIVRLHEYLESRNNRKIIWERGMVLASNGCRALVQEIREGVATGLNQISIEVMGRDRDDCKDLLREITGRVDAIHRESFPTLTVVKMVPCICQVCRESVSPHFYYLEELKDRRADGKMTIECRFRPYEVISIKSLLEGVLSHDERIVSHKP